MRLHRVYFARELLEPMHITAGSMFSLTREQFEFFRATPAGLEAVIDLTPRPIPEWFDAMSGRVPFSEKPASPVLLAPCPDCTEIKDGKLAFTKSYTYCETCDNEHTVVAPITYGERELAAYREELQKAARSTLEKRKSP